MYERWGGKGWGGEGGVAFTYIGEVEDGRVHGGSVLLRTVSLWISCGDLYE